MISTATRLRVSLLAPSLAAITLACSEQPGSDMAPTAVTAEAATPATILATGDIAGCMSHFKDEVTADMLADMPGTILALGDVIYSDGTRWQFRNCYDPSWGRL